MDDAAAKTGRFVDVAAVADLRENFVTMHRVAGRAVAVARKPDGVAVFQGTCTHAKFNFSNSRLAGGCDIECPIHGARFDAVTGAVTKGPAKLPLPRLESQIENGVLRVFVDWPEAP